MVVSTLTLKDPSGAANQFRLQVSGTEVNVESNSNVTFLKDLDVKLTNGATLTNLGNTVASNTTLVNTINSKINSEIARATAEDTTHTAGIATIGTNLANEIARATSQESLLISSLAAEIVRAKSREDGIANQLANLVSNTDPAAIDSITEIIATFTQNGAVVLTTSAGITNTAGEVLLSGGRMHFYDSIPLTMGTDDDLSMSHDGTNSILTTSNGNFTIDNTTSDKKTIMMLGTDTTATAFEVQNNSATTLFKVDGSSAAVFNSSQLSVEAGGRCGFGTTDVNLNIGDTQVGVLNSSNQSALWVKSNDQASTLIVESTHTGSTTPVCKISAPNQSDATNKLLQVAGSSDALTVWGDGKVSSGGDVDCGGSLSATGNITSSGQLSLNSSNPAISNVVLANVSGNLSVNGSIIGGGPGNIQSGSLTQMLAITSPSEGQQFYCTTGTVAFGNKKLCIWTGNTWQVTGETTEMLAEEALSVGSVVEPSGSADFSVVKCTTLADKDYVGVVVFKSATASGEFVTVAYAGVWDIAVVSGNYSRNDFLKVSITTGLADNSTVGITSTLGSFGKVIQDKTTAVDGEFVKAIIHTVEKY